MLGIIPKRHRVFLLRFARVALPLALEMFLHNLVVFVDNVMVGQLGESSVAGVYVAGRIHFFLFLLIFGLVSGSTISFGQYWGKKDLVSFRKTFGFSFLCVVVVTLVFTCIVKLRANDLLGIFSRDSSVLSEGSKYLHIVAFGYIFQSISFIFFTTLRVMGKTSIPLCISAIGLVCNVVLDAILIFGFWIFPAMGVQGAALATVISFLLQALLAFRMLLKESVLRGKIRDFLQWGRSFIRGYAKVTYPVVLNEMGWSLGILMYDFVLGVLGKEAQAAFSVTESFFRTVMVLFMGSGFSSTVIFSTMIGAGRLKKVKEYAKKILILSTSLGFVFAASVISLAWSLPAFYNFEPETKRMLTGMIIAFGIPFPIRVINLHMIVGILRAGTDTFFAMLTEVGTLWLIGVPTVMFVGLVLGWYPPLVMLSAGLEELVKCFIGIWRFRSGRWIKQIAH